MPRWYYTARDDGRIELGCEHGVGHTSHKLTMAHGRTREDRYFGEHGCDGCCGKDSFSAAEEYLIYSPELEYEYSEENGDDHQLALT